MTKRSRMLHETLSPYGERGVDSGTTKLSISLPTELVDVVRTTARESGSTVSALIAAALRRTLEEAEQAEIDRALEADAEEDLAWAEAYLPVAAKLWSKLQW